MVQLWFKRLVLAGSPNLAEPSEAKPKPNHVKLWQHYPDYKYIAEN